VSITVHAPPSGPASTLYEPYAIADFENPEFVRIVLEGLRCNNAFASKFIQTEADYGGGLKGRMILDALGRTSDLTPLPLAVKPDPRRLFKVDTMDDLRATLQMIMADASVQLTSALVVAGEAQAVPVANDPYFLKLLSLRTSAAKYVGESATHAWLVGLEFAKAVIPDEALQKLSLGEIVTYRRKTDSLYQAWTADLNQIAAKIDDLTVGEAHDRIPKLIVTELGPKVVAYKGEMATIRDTLFGGLMKGIVDWKAPMLSVASFTTLGFTAAATAFASSLLAAEAKPIVDYFMARRGVARKHAVAYLIGLANN